MATLTEMVAAVVLQSSAAAFSHFGVTLETPQAEPRPTPVAEQRIVARTRRGAERIERAAPLQKAVTCPEERARLMKA